MRCGLLFLEPAVAVSRDLLSLLKYTAMLTITDKQAIRATMMIGIIIDCPLDGGGVGDEGRMSAGIGERARVEFDPLVKLGTFLTCKEA